MIKTVEDQDKKLIEEYSLIPELGERGLIAKYGALSNIDVDLRLNKKSDNYINETYSERDIFIYTKYVQLNEMLKKYIESFVSFIALDKDNERIYFHDNYNGVKTGNYIDYEEFFESN